MTITTQKNGPVSTIIIDRPTVRNAIDRPTAQSLADAFRAFEADQTALVAVLYGANGTFCAGADLKALAAGIVHRIEPEGDAPLGPTRMLLSKPVIAAISGYAVAGGLELALWCDLRIVEEDAVMGIFCRRWGTPLIDGGTIRLPRLIGLSHALDMLLTGRPVHADEARMMGLANRVVPTGTARQAAEALAAEIAAFPQRCMRNDRLSAYEQFGLPMEAAMQNEFQRGLDSLQDSAEGIRRYASGEGRGGSFSAA